MTLAVSAYVEVANTLRELSILDTPGNCDSFNTDKRDEIRRQLKGQFKTSRKSFTFGITGNFQP